MTISEIIKNKDLREFKPVPFWSINSKLDVGEIKRQISEMNEFGLGGFIFHARAGLETPYLSDEWFEAVGVALEKAKELGLKAWLYDEYGWPSGFVGGKLLKDEKNRAGIVIFLILASPIFSSRKRTKSITRVLKSRSGRNLRAFSPTNRNIIVTKRPFLPFAKMSFTRHTAKI